MMTLAKMINYSAPFLKIRPWLHEVYIRWRKPARIQPFVNFIRPYLQMFRPLLHRRYFPHK